MAIARMRGKLGPAKLYNSFIVQHNKDQYTTTMSPFVSQEILDAIPVTYTFT